MTRRTRRNPQLKFGPTTTRQGFTHYSMSSFGDLRPARIVRELIQNSLDAAVEAGEATARVRFKATWIGPEEVPDVAGYKKAFRAAVEDQTRMNGELSDAAQQVVVTIDEGLRQLSDHGTYCLSVLDNGIGLNEKRMNALLGDGASFKAAEAAGSYGVGHFSTIPASDLRYVLYGGVVGSGERVASGIAVLASRSAQGQANPYAAQGYLVDGFKSGEDGSVYEFMNARHIPTIIDVSLQEIRKEWGHGTVVVIPAFNYFGGERWLWDVVSKVSAYNFNAAIHRRRLVVEVDERDIDGTGTVDVRRLDADTLGAVLKTESSGIRSARKGSFFEGLRPSGQHAHAVWLTLVQGDRHSVTTSAGAIDVRLLEPAPAGNNVRVDLYRNGMWITDDVFGLKRADFSNRPPFHAVLMLDANNEFHRLVRKAEGPMHDALEFNRLSRDERGKLKEALRETGAWIKQQVPEISTEDYTPDDFLVVETGGDQPGGDTKRYSLWGTPVLVQRPPVQASVTKSSVTIDPNDEPLLPASSRHSSEKKESKKKTGGKSWRGTRSLPFRSTAVPDGAGRYIIAFECREPLDEILLSLRLDENTDVTCDRVWPDEDVRLKSFRIRRNARSQLSVPGGRLTEDKKALRLTGLSAGAVCELTVEHESTTEELEGAVETPVLRVDLHRPAPAGDDDGDES